MLGRLVRAIVIAVVTVGLTIGLAVSTVAPAQAAARGDGDKRHCVTIKEYKKVKRGQKKGKVHRRLDTRGRFWDGHAGGYTRMYEPCWTRPKKGQLHGSPKLVFITYAAWPSRGYHRVAEKRIAVPR